MLVVVHTRGIAHSTAASSIGTAASSSTNAQFLDLLSIRVVEHVVVRRIKSNTLKTRVNPSTESEQ